MAADQKGLDYWEARWLNAKTPGDGSWDGDEFARRLEQEWIFCYLAATAGPILDLGCGAGALFEGATGAKLYEIALKRGYLGVDGSTAAIARAQKDLPGLTFEVCDLSQAWPKNAADVVISRRFLQNLTQEQRAPLISGIRTFPYAILLECTIRGLTQTNIIRSAMGHYPALKEPEFNYFLTTEELAQLGGRVSWPLGRYYALTRGILDNRNSEEAYNISSRLLARPLGVPMGLVAGISW